MPKNHSVSCVIPVFNGERFLPEAIESVLTQRGFDIESIIVDDGSTDGTRDVARRFAGRAKYVRQPNAGPAIARNEGFRRAVGKYVTLLDSDDLRHPDKTTIQVALFEARPELAICTAQMENFWSAEVEYERATQRDGRLMEIQPNLGSSFMARRSMFDATGLLDGTLAHRDIQDLILRATDRGLAVEALSDVLVKRRIHAANMSRHRSDAGDIELLAIARARIARRRQPAA